MENEREAVGWVWTDRWGDVHHLSRLDGDDVQAVMFAPIDKKKNHVSENISPFRLRSRSRM